MDGWKCSSARLRFSTQRALNPGLVLQLGDEIQHCRLPCVVARRSSGGAAHAATLLRKVLNVHHVPHYLHGVSSLQHKSIDERDGIVLSRRAGKDDPPRRHGLQADESKRLTTAVGQHAIHRIVNHLQKRRRHLELDLDDIGRSGLTNSSQIGLRRNCPWPRLL